MDYSFGEAFGYTVRSTSAPWVRHHRKTTVSCARHSPGSIRLQVQADKQFFKGAPLTGLVGVVGLLGQGDAKCSGIDRHMGHKTVVALLSLDGQAAQGLAVTDQLVQTVGPAWGRVFEYILF